MSQSPRNLIIEGNFNAGYPNQGFRVFKKLGLTAMSAVILLSLLVYGITVHYESQINQMGKETRDLDEMNKDLQVRLNRIRSFENVEHAATQAPQLHLPEEVIELTGIKPVILPEPTKHYQEAPQVYGY